MLEQSERWVQVGVGHSEPRIAGVDLRGDGPEPESKRSTIGAISGLPAKKFRRVAAQRRSAASLSR